MEFNFGKLEAHNDAVDYANRVYAITKKFPKDEIFGITNQVRRPSVSIPTNIASLRLGLLMNAFHFFKF